MKKIKLFTIGFVLTGLLTVLTSDSEKNITQLFTTKVANASGTGADTIKSFLMAYILIMIGIMLMSYVRRKKA
jgi:hypothetical protein